MLKLPVINLPASLPNTKFDSPIILEPELTPAAKLSCPAIQFPEENPKAILCSALSTGFKLVVSISPAAFNEAL